jgi:Flp pilus assembly protein TadB
VAALAGGALGWWGPDLLRPNGDGAAEERTEAIASWCELLRDAVGTSRGIEGMLVATAGSAPAPIRAEVEALARRLQFEPIGTALDRLADDLNDPLGDLVVTALRLAATAGARRVREVLDDLAAAAHLEASMQRRLDVARQRPRSTMRLVAGIVTVFVAGLVLFAPRYLAPYRTPVGQLVLLVIAGYWGLGFWWMARMGRVPHVPRFLAVGKEDRR